MRTSRRLSVRPEGQHSPDVERSEDQADENKARVQRRARTNVRRYCLHNGLGYMPTLTYAKAPESVDEISEDVRKFRYRLLRAPWGPSEAFPYVWVPETGSQATHRLHAHMAVGRWYLEAGCVEVCQTCATAALRAKRGRSLAPAGSACWGCLWGEGFVGSPSEGTNDPRALAGYVSKYVGKDLGAEVAAGRHTYRVAEGFRPVPIRLEVQSMAEAGSQLQAWVGPDESFSVEALHEKYEDWRGPATWSIRWGQA
jgi:hypothetical protein